VTDLRPLLRIEDVAALMDCSADSILRDVVAGVLKVHRRPNGRAFLVRPEEFEAYLRRLEVQPAADTVKARARRRVPNGQRDRLRAIAGGKIR
jgi:hypothetical protein